MYIGVYLYEKQWVICSYKNVLGWALLLLPFHCIQLISSSDIKQDLDYLNFTLEGSLNLFIFLLIILALCLCEEKFWWENHLIEML